MATTGLFDDLPDLETKPQAPAPARPVTGLFDDLPDISAAPVTRPKSPDDRGLPISGPRPAPEPDTVGTIEGILSSAKRGMTAGLRGLDAMAAKGDQSDRPTIRQERKAYEAAMNDPAYQQKLIQAMGDSMQFGGDPQANTAAMSRVEATRGPMAKLEQAMRPAVTAKEAREFDIAEATRQMEAAPRSEAMKQWEAADNSNWFKVLAKNPVEIIANITAESLPQSIPGMVAGAAAGSRLGPGGAAVGMGAGSLAVEYANSLVDGAQKAGYDFRKEEDVRRFFNNEEAVSKASEFALKRGVPIAVLDGLSASMAGKLVSGAVGKGVKPVAKAAAGEIGVQAAAGASGEALAQGVSGQELSLKDIVAEAIGELATAPSEVATNVRGEMARLQDRPATAPQPTPPKPAEPKPVFDPKELERILRSNQVRPEPKPEPAPKAPAAPPAETKPPEPSEMAATLERLLRENEVTPVKPPESSPTPPKPEPPAGTELRNETGVGVAPASRPSRLEEDLNDLQGTIDVIRKRLEDEQQSRTTPEVRLPSPAAEPEAGAAVPVPPAAAPATPFPRGSRVTSSRYGAGEVVRQIGKRVQVQFDDGTKFTVSPGELTRVEAPAAPEPGAEVGPKILPVPKNRQAESRFAAERAPWAKDLDGKPTGWKFVNRDDGATLVSPDGTQMVRFEAQDKRSGSEAQRQKALAQAWAIDNIRQLEEPSPPPSSPKEKGKAPNPATTTRADAKEFDRLMLEYGIQERWVSNPEATYDQSAELGQQQGTASIKARIMRSKEIAKARRRAAFQIAGTSDIDPGKPEVRAQLLPKLRAFIEQKYEAPARQAQAWEKATEAGKRPVNADDLKVGDVLDVEGDKVSVVGVDPDTGDVTLQDGTRFGRQVLASGQVIYVEDVDAKEVGTDFAPEDETETQPAPKKTFREVVEEVKAKKKQSIEAILKDAGTVEIGIEFVSKTDPTVKLLLTPDNAEAGKWRVTRIDSAGPVAHNVFDSWKQAVYAVGGDSFSDLNKGPAWYGVGEFKVKRKMPAPKLRSGERQGDLMATQTEDFTLAQESATDGDRITREREQKARDKAESEKGQMELGAAKDTPASIVVPDKMQDFGEKIGGARKDVSEKGDAFTPPKPRTKSDKPTWARPWEVTEIVKDSDKSNIGKWTISKKDDKWYSRRNGVYDTKEQAELALPLIAVAEKHRVYSDSDNKGKFAIYRNVTDRKRVIIKGNFDTEREAMEYLAKNAVEILEKKTSFGEEILALREGQNITRQGPERRKVDATAEMFQDTFGFRGVEFGNWETGIERIEVMNNAYDGLLDMAEIIGVPPKAISLNGQLALAFGARGQGLAGARAHYEPEKVVINITKMKGAGALAHEWMHALDHYFARIEGRSPREWQIDKDGTRSMERLSDTRTFVTSGEMVGSKMRPEVAKAWDNLRTAMNYKLVQQERDLQRATKWAEAPREEIKSAFQRLRDHIGREREYGAKKKPATAEQLAEFDRLTERIVENQTPPLEWKRDDEAKSKFGTYRYTNADFEALNKLVKNVTGRAGFGKDSGYLNDISTTFRHYQQRLQELKKAQAGEAETKRVPTEYRREAVKADQGRASDYWAEPWEMAARAFSSYIEDKLSEQQRRSGFLSVGNSEADNRFFQFMYGFKPFTEGAERQAINQSFEDLFSTLKTVPETRDNLDEWLTKWIDKLGLQPGALYEGVTGAPVWMTKAVLRTALQAIRAAYRGGKALAAAIEEGIENLREQNIKGFDAEEARQWFRENVWENIEEGRLKVSKNRGPREVGEVDAAAAKKEAYAKSQLSRMGATLINGNALPREFRDARDWGLGLQRYFEENLRLMVEDTRKAIRAEFPKLEDRAAAEERLRQYWIGEADVSTVGGPAVQKAAASFRDAVDELTTVAVRNGLVPDEKKQTWLDNRGEWLRRTYLAFDPAADWNYDTLKRRKEAGDAEVTRIWNNAQAYLEAQNPQASPKQIEAAMRELIDRREAENALLGSTPPPGSGKRFAVDTGSLLRRKDLPLPIREWMGEIKDPFVRGLQSGKWMSQFITRNLVQRRFAKIGLKLGVLSETPEGRNFVELYPNQNRLMQKRDEEGNPITTEEGEPVGEWRQSVDRRFEPLHGYYTSPEFKAALDEFNGTVNQMSRLVDTAELALRSYIGANRVTKWALVGMNPFSWSVNTVGGQILRLAAGGINPISYKRAFSAIHKGNDPVDIDATEKQLRDRATYLLATKAGLTGKGIMQGDIQGSSEQRNDPEAWATGKKAILDIAKDWRAKGAWSRLRRSITDIAMKPGNMGIKFMDDVFRVSAFLDELELAKKAFPDWKHEKQVEWAAERASNVYQNYDKLPDLLRGASQLGILNTFVSFKVEMFRNAFWILRYAFNGIDSNNPALRRDGYKKLMAFTAMATLPFIAAAVSRLKFADEEDETFEDAGKQIDALQRWVVPPWDSGEEIFIMGREGNTWSYVPMGYLVPTYEVTRPLATLVDAAKEENGELALKRIMQGFASDYFGPGTVAGPAGEAVFNKTLSGGPVTEAEGMRGFKDRAGHAVNTLRPKIADPVFETYKATTGQLGNYGRKYDTSEVAWKLAGFRVRTVDVEKQLSYKMQDFSRRYNQAKSYSTKMERRNPGDAEKVTDAKEYTKAKREGIREEYKAFHRDMTKVLGVSERDFGAAQKEAGVPSELRAALYQ